MRRLFLLGMGFAMMLHGMASAMPHVYMWCNPATYTDNWSPTARQNIGLFSNIHFTETGGSMLSGFPDFYSFDIREIALVSGSNSFFSTYVPLQAEQGFQRLGAQTRTGYSSKLNGYIPIEVEQVTQTYRYTDPYNRFPAKDFDLGVTAVYYPNGRTGAYAGKPEASVSAALNWKTGIPAYSPSYNSPRISTSGPIVRTDWNPYFAANASSWEVAQGDFLALVPTDPWTASNMWVNYDQKILGRFYDTEWQTRTAPVADLMWIRDWMGSRCLHSFAAVSPIGSAGFYMGQAKVAAALTPQRTVYTGDGYDQVHLPEFCKPGRGQDQVVYLCNTSSGQSETAGSTSVVNLFMQRATGNRSVAISIYTNNATYRDPLYKVNQNGVNNSLQDAFSDIMYGASPYLANDLCFIKMNRSLTCPDSSCSPEELFCS